MGVAKIRKREKLWLVGERVDLEWLREDVRDGLRNTAYALLGFGLSVFGYALVVPLAMTRAISWFGAVEIGEAFLFWVYADRRATRLGRGTALSAVSDVLGARRLATWSTAVGLLASVALLGIAFLTPKSKHGPPPNVFHVFGARLSVSANGLAVGAGVVFGVMFLVIFAVVAWNRQAAGRGYWRILSLRIFAQLSKGARTVAQLAQDGIEVADVERWLQRAKSEGMVEEHPQSGARSEVVRWALTEAGADRLRARGVKVSRRRQTRSRPRRR